MPAPTYKTTRRKRLRRLRFFSNSKKINLAKDNDTKKSRRSGTGSQLRVVILVIEKWRLIIVIQIVQAHHKRLNDCATINIMQAGLLHDKLCKCSINFRDVQVSDTTGDAMKNNRLSHKSNQYISIISLRIFLNKSSQF